MTDIGLTGTVSIDEGPAIASLAAVDSAAEDTAASVNALGDEGSAAVAALMAAFSGLADSAEAAALKISTSATSAAASMSGIETATATAAASFAGMADSADAASAKIAAGSSRIVSGMGGIEKSTGLVRGLNQTVGATAAIITVASVASMKFASDFDQKMAHVAANAGMNNTELAQMRDTVLSLGRDTGSSFDDLADGFMHIHNLGFQAADAVHVLTVANMSAVSTGASVSDTAELLAKSLHEYGGAASQASEYMNVMHVASQRGNQTLEQFDSAMGPVIGQAANLGVSLQDVSAAEAALTQHGFDAAESATQLKAILDHMIQPTGQSADAIKALGQASGVDLVRDFSKAGLESKGLSGVFADLRTALKLTKTDTDVLANAQSSGLLAEMAKLDPASKEYQADLDMMNSATGGHIEKIMKLIPAMRGGIGAMILLGTGAEDYTKNLNALNDAMSGKVDPTMSDFLRTMGTSSQQFAIMSNNVEYDAVVLGNKLLPAVIRMLPALKDMADDAETVLTWFSKLPQPVQDATYVVGGLYAANMLLGGALGGTSVGIVNLIKELPIFTGLTATAAGAEGAEGLGAAATTTGGLVKNLGNFIGYASETEVTWAGTTEGAISVTGLLTGAVDGLGAAFAAIPGLVATAGAAVLAFAAEAAVPLALLAAVGAVGYAAKGIADSSIDQSDAEMRGNEVPEFGAYEDKMAALRGDERAHPGDKSKDDEQISKLHDMLSKIVGGNSHHVSGHNNEQNYLHKQNNERDYLHQLHQPHIGTGGGAPITSGEVPGKAPKETKTDADKSGGIDDAVREVKTALGELDMPVPMILGKLVSGSHAVEIATKLMTGEIKGATTAQAAYIVGLATAEDRLGAGKSALGGYEESIRGLNKDMALGKDATTEQSLAYDFHREGLLKLVPVTASMTAAERKSIEAQNDHIEAVNTRLTADRATLLNLTQEKAASDILTDAKKKLTEATLTQTQAAMLSAAGSQAELDSLSAADKATLALTISQTEQAERLKSAYTSALGVLDDYIKKAQDAGAAARGPQSFTQQSQSAVADLKGQKDYDPTDPATAAKIQEALEAGKALDDQSAISDITKWGTAWSDALGELSAKMSGTYTDGAAAFDAWKRDNEQGLLSVKAALGDNYQAWEDNIKATIEQSAALQKVAAQTDDYRKTAADLRHEIEILSTTDPYAKWQLQQQIYDPNATDKSGNVGAFTKPAGSTDDQQKNLFNAQQELGVINEVGDDMQSVFASAFDTAFKKGTDTFLVTLKKGVITTLEEAVSKGLAANISENIKSLLTKMSHVGAPDSKADTKLGSAADDVKKKLAASDDKALLTANNKLDTSLGLLKKSVDTLNSTLKSGSGSGGASPAGSGGISVASSGAGGGGFDFMGAASEGAGIASMLHFADGGTFDGSEPFVAGEEGPEVIHPASGGRVLNHNDTMKALSSRNGGGDTYHSYNTNVTVVAPTPSAYIKSTSQIARETSRTVARSHR